MGQSENYVIKKDSKYVKKMKEIAGEGFSQEKLDIALKGIEAIIDLSGEGKPSRDGLSDTPHRVVKMFMEYTEGYHEDPREHLRKQFEVDSEDLVLVKDIPFVSLCEHHFAPFYGVAHVGYIPGRNSVTGKPVITGLSKIGRLVQGYAKRFQVQEGLNSQIAKAMDEVLKPKGTVVVIEATHTCMCLRGLKATGATTITSSMKGVFQDNPTARAEVLALINTSSKVK